MPLRDLLAYHEHGLGIADHTDFLATRDTKRGPRTKRVHIRAAEGVWVYLEQCQHHARDAHCLVRAESFGELPECVGGRYGAVVALEKSARTGLLRRDGVRRTRPDATSLVLHGRRVDQSGHRLQQRQQGDGRASQCPRPGLATDGRTCRPPARGITDQ